MLPTTRLADLVKRKHGVLVRLSALGERQRAIVESGETTELLKLLATKQTMITTLQEIEHDMAPYYSENPDARVWASPEARADCAKQAAECNRLLAEIVAAEQQSAERMTARRNEVAAQLRLVHAAGQARSAYEAQR